MIGRKDMDEEAVTGNGEPIGHHGNPLHGGTSVHDAIQIICSIPQGSMDTVSSEELAKMGTMPFQKYRKFIELCDKSTLEYKAKVS